MIDLSAYVRESLRDDGQLALHRGRHAARDGEPSVLLLACTSTSDSAATVARVEHEWELAAELDPEWAVRPRALVLEDGRPTLVLDDPGGAPLDRLIAGPMAPGRFLPIAVGLAHALAKLHARGLIHKDVKPANVLVDPATGHARLMGFGIASRRPRERQAPAPPEIIAGTLAYMAPEQTGRMNRSIDARSDLYALGVTLYEMLTGTLPFSASEPMAWVHCHVARTPIEPAARVTSVPLMLSAIVMKLLAKTPEDRYQTAAGVAHDLRRCRDACERHGRIDDFPLAERDTPDRLRIPETLYGRTREVEALVAAFDRVVRTGTPELVLVSGYSGIGKSSVVNELHTALMRTRGLFAAGKFDQHQRDIPYATLTQAFQSLARHLLAKPDAELSRWRERLADALGANAGLVTDLVPELKLLIGDPPPVPELPPQEAQRRFQLVFRRFLAVFARPEHPLALFLDDLQWLDAATLDVVEGVLTAGDVSHVLLIGAYRDNEVGPAHPLTRKLDAIRRGGAAVTHMTLAPLSRDDVAELLAGAFRCEPARAADLAGLIQEKTGGNPFFVIQFLSVLAEEGLLIFDQAAARWSWDVGRIRTHGYTDNVADLMVAKLGRLAATTRTALCDLACLGNAATNATLALVRDRTLDELGAELREAVEFDLITDVGNAYRFVHDRVQEAAYSLVPEDLRPAAHLRIGRLLVATAPDRREETIFEIVSQLNRGAALMIEAEEREKRPSST